MARTFIAIILFCTLLGAVTSLPHDGKHTATETNQEEYMIKRQEMTGETATSEQAPAEESGTSEQPDAEEAGTLEQPVAEEAGTPEQPAAEEAVTPEQPVAEETGTPEQPAAEEAGTLEQPAVEEIGTLEQPAAEGTGAPEQPAAEETPNAGPTGESTIDSLLGTTGGETETPSGEPTEGDTMIPTGDDQAKPSIVSKEYNANEATDWLFTLTINNPPQNQSGIRFQEEAGEKVGIGETTASFEFRNGTLEKDGMLEIPVYVKNHAETKQMSFTVELDGESNVINVNVKAAEPVFKVLENEITASEETQYKFILKMQEKNGMLNYTFKEGDKDAVAGGETDSFKFGDLVHMPGGNLDKIEVTVTDLSKNTLYFDVTANETTEPVTVNIRPPTKPMLLQRQFTVGENNNYTFTLQIKSKHIPDVIFKDRDQEAKPEGKTDYFTFGTMTNDVDNLYKIQVKVTKDIDEPLKFTAKLNDEEEEVTVKREDESSALISASATLTCLFVPLFVILLS